jgi:hypothetical protein
MPPSDFHSQQVSQVTLEHWPTADGESESAAPRQYAFDEVLEQHVGQAEVFDLVGMQPVNAALSGKVGAVLCFGASGDGKDFSLRCERPGQEGLLLRALALIFSGSASLDPASARALPEANGDVKVRLSYLPDDITRMLWQYKWRVEAAERRQRIDDSHTGTGCRKHAFATLATAVACRMGMPHAHPRLGIRVHTQWPADFAV